MNSTKLGVLIPGLNGAVSTTFITGTLLINKGLAKPVGSFSQLGNIKFRNKNRTATVQVRNIPGICSPGDLIFGGWDIRNENCYQSALEASVLNFKDIEPVKDKLQKIRPMPGVFDPAYIKNLKASWIKKGQTKFNLMEQLRSDIKEFKKANAIEECVMIWCASTETFIDVEDVHSDIRKFEKGMKENHPAISPSMLYAYAAVSEGIPFVNGAPNLTADIPALEQLALEKNVPVAGKDFKTGQTLLKTVIAPMLKARMLGLNGWFSSNILGNRDGEVLDDPGSFKTKEHSKLSVLEGILQPSVNPELYGNFHHMVKINYYPPRGDNKEGWDNIDIFGWLGYPMQIKIDFLCRDSILAAPLVLDLVLLAHLAKRNGMAGVQGWLSFYFKSPMHTADSLPEHDLFVQFRRLKSQLKKIYIKNRKMLKQGNGKDKSPLIKIK